MNGKRLLALAASFLVTLVPVSSTIMFGRAGRLDLALPLLVLTIGALFISWRILGIASPGGKVGKFAGQPLGLVMFLGLATLAIVGLVLALEFYRSSEVPAFVPIGALSLGFWGGLAWLWRGIVESRHQAKIRPPLS